MGPRNRVRWGPDPPWEWAILSGKGHLIVKYRDTLRSPCKKTSDLIMMPFGLWAWTGPRNHKLDGVPDPPGEKWSPVVKYRDFSAMSSAETAEPIDLPFGLWTLVGQRNHKFNCVSQVAPVCPHVRAHWWHLANTVESSRRRCGLLTNYFDHLLFFITQEQLLRKTRQS